MSVLKVTEQGHQRTAGVSVAANGQITGDSVRCFQVHCSIGTDDESICLFAVDPHGGPSVPNLFDPHPTRLGVYCADKGVRWVDGTPGRVGEVLCTYRFIQPFRFPWDQPPIYAWDSTEVDAIVEKDLATGASIVNSSKQPFTPGVSALRLDATLTVTRNELSPVDPSLYNGCVNSDFFKGSQPGYCKLKITATEAIYQDEVTGAQTPYWVMVYVFQFKNPMYFGWQAKVADSGYCKLVGGQLQTILINGREPTTPPFLDGSGGQLGAAADPVYLDFTTYPTQAFTPLGL
jgi:hypothetical protein